MAREADPRIAVVVKAIEDVRMERLKRMLTVKDMRRNDGRVKLADEAKAILDALDDYESDLFDAMLAERAKGGAQ